MISFVYFDLGGVVVKDFSASDEWDLLRQDLGIRNEDREKFNTVWIEYEKQICTSLPIDEIIPLLEEEFHAVIPHGHSLLKNFVKYFEENQTIWTVIEEVKKNLGVGLLTSMYVGMFDEITKRNILPPVQWDVIVDSSIVGYAKPDKKIYEIAQEKAGVLPENILFIDNNSKNILAAAALGWETYFYDSSDYEASTKTLQLFLEQNILE